MEQIFKILDFVPFEHWNDPTTPVQNIPNDFNPYVDKAQFNDPLMKLFSEVEQPTKLRKFIKKWRSGAELRFKMPYYPETKEPEKSFNYI
jgi:hypothetical protein